MRTANYFKKSNQDFILSGTPLHKELYSGDQEIHVNEHVIINDDDVFLYPATANILENLEDVFNIINYHQAWIAPKYKLKRDYYKGRHHEIIGREKKPLNKPDARLVINLPKKLVNTFNGYFSGDPVQIKHQSDDTNDDVLNDKIQAWLNDNDYADVFSEWAKQADIYGRSYLYAYFNDGALQITACSPRDTILVYDNSVVHRPLFGIRYSPDADVATATLITPKADYELVRENGKIVVTNADSDDPSVVKKSSVHTFPITPLFELAEDDERTGIFDDTMSLIDSIDDVFSAKANDISAFSDSYLVVTGQKLSPQQVEDIVTKRLINLYTEINTNFNNETPTPPDVKFLTPNPNDETQENWLNRAIDLVYQISQVVNLNDSNFGMSAQSISGVALLQRYQPMQAKARTKALKMDKALRQLFTLLFDFWGDKSLKVSDLTFEHKQSIPHNLSEEAGIITKLNGQVDDVTKLSFFSGIDNPQKAVDRLHDQEDEEAKKGDASLQQYLSDQQKQKGGVSDDANLGAGQAQNTNSAQSR